MAAFDEFSRQEAPTIKDITDGLQKLVLKAEVAAHEAPTAGASKNGAQLWGKLLSVLAAEEPQAARIIAKEAIWRGGYIKQEAEKFLDARNQPTALQTALDPSPRPSVSRGHFSRS